MFFRITTGLTSLVSWKKKKNRNIIEIDFIASLSYLPFNENTYVEKKKIVDEFYEEKKEIELLEEDKQTETKQQPEEGNNQNVEEATDTDWWKGYDEYSSEEEDLCFEDSEEYSESWHFENYHNNNNNNNRKGRFYHSSHPKRLRSKKSDKKEKINPNRYLKLSQQRKQERKDELILGNIGEKKMNILRRIAPFIPVNTPWEYIHHPSPSTINLDNNNKNNNKNKNNDPNLLSEIYQINSAIVESQTQLAPCGLSYQQILELQTRELTPEDYEMLSILDETIKKKTLSQKDVELFPKQTIDNELLKKLTDTCTICMTNYGIGEHVKVLPCNHTFHSHCIDQWLTHSSVTCPLDGLSVEAFFGALKD